jgi:hypothetical protein
MYDYYFGNLICSNIAFSSSMLQIGKSNRPRYLTRSFLRSDQLSETIMQITPGAK